MKCAFEEICSGASIRSIARHYHIPTTLYDHVSAKSKLPKGSPTALSIEDEEYIVTALEYAGECGWLRVAD